MKTLFEFEYALKHPEHGFYLGTAREVFSENFSHNPNLSNPVYLYTKFGAEQKVKNLQVFQGCKIVKF
tara:strand:- start:1734 stop:1937 length:204 start_codon:yes stop_codon:yes gene_type:complete